MILECVGIGQIGSFIRTHQQDSRQIHGLKLRALPWLEFLIACGCLAEGMHFLYESDPIRNLIGFVLLASVPRCCYLGWRDYRAAKEARVVITLRWYLTRPVAVSIPARVPGIRPTLQPRH